MGAAPETGTDPTIGIGKLDFDDRLALTVPGVCPALARTSLGTGDLLLFPIDPKRLCRKPFAFAGLPFLVTAGGSVEIHAVLALALDQEFGLPITGIHQVTARQKIFLLQRFRNARNDLAITGRGSGGFDMPNQVGLILLSSQLSVKWTL